LLIFDFPDYFNFGLGAKYANKTPIDEVMA